jgi:hypothetical protein
VFVTGVWRSLCRERATRLGTLRGLIKFRSLVSLTCLTWEPQLGGFTHGVIPGQNHTEALGISSPGIDEAHFLGFAITKRSAMEHYVGLNVSLKLTASVLLIA